MLLTALTAAARNSDPDYAVALHQVVSNNLPNTITGALDSPVIQDLVREIGKHTVQAAIEFQLAIVNELVSCTKRLTEFQIPIIAQQLLLEHPMETLADFKVCFLRASIGRYNDSRDKLVWLDGVVIGQWMSKYLDEKYEALEARLMSEKENPYEVVHRKPPPFNLVEEFNKVHDTAVQKIPAMSRETILEQGQKDPPPRPAISWRSTTAEEHAARQKQLEASKKAYMEALREKYPGLSDEQLNSMTL